MRGPSPKQHDVQGIRSGKKEEERGGDQVEKGGCCGVELTNEMGNASWINTILSPPPY